MDLLQPISAASSTCQPELRLWVNPCAGASGHVYSWWTYTAAWRSPNYIRPLCSGSLLEVEQQKCMFGDVLEIAFKLLEGLHNLRKSYTELRFLCLFLLLNSYIFVILTKYCEIFDGFVQPVFPTQRSKMQI